MNPSMIIGILSIGFAICNGDVSHLIEVENQDVLYTTTTEPPPHHPYFFGYSAGRFPGHIDRTHSEISDGSGVVRGSFSYVDPGHQLRVVDYLADKSGFHAFLNKESLPQKDSAAVAAAKQRHYELYAKIANSHAHGVAEENIPLDTVSVARAKVKHQNLYEKIAADHQRIGAEQAAQRAILEADQEAKRLAEESSIY